MHPPTAELLLALRSPTSGWLAAMICLIEEAGRDSSFNKHHRELMRGLLDIQSVPAAIAAAAQHRLNCFEQSVTEIQPNAVSAITELTIGVDRTRHLN